MLEERGVMVNAFYDLGINIVIYIQNLGGWLSGPMNFFSFLGTTEFYLFIMPLLYWCLDTSLGIRVGLILLLSSGINTILKLAFHTPRPFWFSRQVEGYAFESSFGLPSGHAQNSAAVFGLIAATVKKRWVWVLSLALIFLIGISRLYLAVHFPQDVILGWIIGFALVWAFLRLENPVIDWLEKRSLSMRILSVLVVSLVVLFLGVLVKAMLTDWQIPTTWVENARLAFPLEELIEPLDFSSLLTSMGAFFGFAAGAIWLSARGGFNARGSWVKRALRFLIGFVGVAILYLGLGAVIPDQENFVGYFLHYIEFALIGLWISAIAPLVFLRLKLAEPKTE